MWRKKKSVETDSKWALDVGFGKDFKVVIIKYIQELKKNAVINEQTDLSREMETIKNGPNENFRAQGTITKIHSLTQ